VTTDYVTFPQSYAALRSNSVFQSAITLLVTWTGASLSGTP
jgi:hypothetical protein